MTKIHYDGREITAVLFDMDRLLVETSAVWEKPAIKVMESLGLEWSLEFSKNYRGMDAKGVVETIFGIFKPDEPIEKYHAIYLDALTRAFAAENITPMPGAEDILRRLKGNVKTALASGSPSGGIDVVLEKFGWRDFFDLAISSEAVREGRGKPFPDVYLEAASLLGEPPENCLVVEDAYNGALAALDAGMLCAAVPSGDADKIRALGVGTYDDLSRLADELLSPS